MSENTTSKTTTVWEKTVMVIVFVLIGVFIGVAIKRIWFYNPVTYLDMEVALDLLEEDYSPIIYDVESAIESGNYRISDYKLDNKSKTENASVTVTYIINSPVEIDEDGNATYSGMLAYRMLKVTYWWSSVYHRWDVLNDKIIYAYADSMEEICRITIDRMIDAVSMYPDIDWFDQRYVEDAIQKCHPEICYNAETPEYCSAKIYSVPSRTEEGVKNDIMLYFKYNSVWEEWELDSYGIIVSD